VIEKKKDMLLNFVNVMEIPNVKVKNVNELILVLKVVLKKKDAYIARHKVNENWNEPTSAGALARFILWNKKTLNESISDFKRRFKC
jgi:hypothetical protein